MNSATPKIKAWLKESGEVWMQEENPNCFTNSFLEAIYVYEDHIKYWEDIRDHSVVVRHKIPETKRELIEVLRPAEGPDEYIDRLIAQAAPQMKNLDPKAFMDEVRGREPENSEE